VITNSDMLKTRILFAFLFSISVLNCAAQATGDYRSRQDGLWSVRNNWERFNGLTWAIPTIGQGVPSSSSGVITILNLRTITVSADITVDQLVVAVGGTLTVNSNVNLNILNGSGTDLSVSGSLNLSGSLVIAANAGVDSNGNIKIISDSNGDGSIGQVGVGGTINGNIVVERYIANPGVRSYRYLASPFTNLPVSSWKAAFPITGTFNDPSTQLEWPLISGIDQTSPSLYFYNQLTDTYLSYPTNGNSSSGQNLINGRGYAAYLRDTAPIVITSSGTVPIGDVPISLTASGTGYNLVGNPYPSAISWDLVDLIGVQVNDTYAILDNTNQTTVGAGNFVYYQQNNPGAAIPASYDGIIASGQAFWVQATTSTTLTFQEANKILAAPAILRKSTPEISNTLRLKVRGNDLTDELIIAFKDDALDASDKNDAQKRKNIKLTFSSLSADGKDMAINTFGTLLSEQIIKLNLQGALEGSYQIDFSQLESFKALPTIEMIDDFTKQTLLITPQNSSYSFSVTSDANSTGSNRFMVKVTNIVTGLEGSENTFGGYPNPIADFYTVKFPRNIKLESPVIAFNLLGQTVNPRVVNSNDSEITYDFSSISQGMFVLKFPMSNGVHLLKVIKK
jgi:hypothetical protein